MPDKKWEVLEPWLMLDFWRPSEACHIFAGLIEIPLHDGESKFKEINEEEYSDDIFDRLLRKQEIELAWNRAIHNTDIKEEESNDYGGSWLFPPEYCIKWALRKRIEIPWLDWAIKEDLVNLKETPRPTINTPSVAQSEGTLGVKREKNILRLISILTERMVNPDMKSNFRSVAHLISDITEKHQQSEPPNSGLSKRTLDSLLAASRRVRPISESEPDD